MSICLWALIFLHNYYIRHVQLNPVGTIATNMYCLFMLIAGIVKMVKLNVANDLLYVVLECFSSTVIITIIRQCCIQRNLMSSRTHWMKCLTLSEKKWIRWGAWINDGSHTATYLLYNSVDWLIVIVTSCQRD